MSNKQITPINRDHLAVLPEEEVRNKTQQLRGWIEAGRRRNHPTYDLEVEHCYFAEELKLRETRRRANEEYIRRNPEVTEVESYN
jgi:hypothetical protein